MASCHFRSISFAIAGSPCCEDCVSSAHLRRHSRRKLVSRSTRQMRLSLRRLLHGCPPRQCCPSPIYVAGSQVSTCPVLPRLRLLGGPPPKVEQPRSWP